ncbi:MAG: Gfo/Idh/MocA family protein, partial [Christensenellales bacterium]
YYDSGDWRGTWNGEGGGVLLNQCPHQLDLMQWLFGMPKTVKAFVNEGKWHDIEVEDDVTAYLEYPNGATGVFITSTGDFPGTNRLEVSFDKGKVICEKGKLTLFELDDYVSKVTKESQQGFTKIKVTESEVETDGENLQHVGVLRAFAANILRGEPLVAPGQEGIFGLMLSNAMHLSSWVDAPVSIPIDEDLFLEELNKRRASSKKKEASSVTFDTSGTY